MAAGIAPPFSPAVKGRTNSIDPAQPAVASCLTGVSQGYCVRTDGFGAAARLRRGCRFQSNPSRAQNVCQSISPAPRDCKGTPRPRKEGAVMSRRIPRQLDPVEIRVLGSLLEKEQTTPEAYPLSLNALVAACGQQTNREPVMRLSAREV